MKKRILILMVVISVFFCGALAQQVDFEYGSEAELKGITRIFIYTGDDLKAHDKIMKKIKKELPDLIITEKVEDAEVVLVFGAKSSTYLSGLNYSGVGSTATANYSTVVVGDGIVVKPIDSDRVRLLMKFTDKRTYIFERKPSTNFARAFIKAYEKANEDKTDD